VSSAADSGRSAAVRIQTLSGAAIEPYLDALAALRIEVFRE
jgi:uncharacterized protein involved in copper resistance